MAQFINNTTIPDVIIINPNIFSDERGFFMEVYNQHEFEVNGIRNVFIQDNHSKSNKGVFRGFHFQTKHIQAKIVRVTSGSVLDFVIDIRKNSSTYGKYIYELLSEKNKKQLFIPKGFAHGFLALEDNTEFLYKCDDYYDCDNERGILYTDKDIGIDWQGIMEKHDIQKLILSEKDRKHFTLKEFYTTNPF